MDSATTLVVPEPLAFGSPGALIGIRFQVGPWAHAFFRAVAGAFAPCATVVRGMLRPTRAIQIQFSKMGTRTSWDYYHRFRTGFVAVSRR